MNIADIIKVACKAFKLDKDQIFNPRHFKKRRNWERLALLYVIREKQRKQSNHQIANALKMNQWTFGSAVQDAIKLVEAECQEMIDAINHLEQAIEYSRPRRKPSRPMKWDLRYNNSGELRLVRVPR